METSHLPDDDEDDIETVERPLPIPSLPGVLATLRRRWPEYVLEIVVIVLSISISFALDQWKERRREHELERLYLATLSDNLASDLDAFDDAIPETKSVIEAARSLMAASTSATPLPPATLDAGIVKIISRPQFVAHDAAFSDLRSSGNLKVLHDFKLKNALFDYYDEYESIKAKETAEREVLITVIAPYIIRNVSLSGAGTPARDAILVQHDRVFVNSLAARVQNRAELLADYVKARALAEKIRARIKADLD
jgi:hypothetical protein